MDTLCSFGSEIHEEPRRAKESGFFWTDSRTGEQGISKCLNKEDKFMLRSQDHLPGPQGGIQSNTVAGQLEIGRLSKLVVFPSLPAFTLSLHLEVSRSPQLV